MAQKRVAAIHDISCFGKCSLTVALPIISAAGIETAAVPTAVLSTHTAAQFKDFTFRDLAQDLLGIAKHWKSLNLEFDAVYTGYLGSVEQIGIVSEMIDLISTKDTKVIVDPVMADNGKLYGNFPKDYPKDMATLCKKADLIIPNMTEAAFLLGQEYKEGPYTKDYCENLVKNLCERLCAKACVLTGVYFDDKELGVCCFDGKKCEFVMNEHIHKMFHGTGDVFGSALVSGVVAGKTLEEAARIAVDFTCASIKRTLAENPERDYGVNFENELPIIMGALNK